MIEIKIDGQLEERGHSFYWLAKATGVSHTTLWRLKKGRALGINFETLEKICRALDCQPGDIIRFARGGRGRQLRAGGPAATSRAARAGRAAAAKGVR